MNRFGITASLAQTILCAAASAQELPKFDSREAANSHFAKLSDELEHQHILALTQVAAGETGEAANATYRLLFNLAIARGEYDAAEPAAERIIQRDDISPDIDLLAHFINVIAEADRGQYEESLKHLEEYVATHKPQDNLQSQLDPNTVLAIGEAYFQRLVQAGRYDIAKRLCEDVLENSKNEAIRAHFTKRMSRVGMLGTPAPAVAGKDIDGKQISLADLKGKVVLVDFWATWCPPCSIQMLKLNALRSRYKERDFEVLGVNVDSLREGSGDAEAVQSQIRRYLIDHQAAFPSIVLPAGDTSIPTAYGVEDIPANFLIDREGKIFQFELGDTNAVKAVEAALGPKK